MKKRLFSLLLVAALLVSPLSIAARAAGYGEIPIYIGYAEVDYMADEILKEIPTAGKSAREQVRAVYDWIIQNCNRYNWDGTYYFDAEQVTSAVDSYYYDEISDRLAAGTLTLRYDFTDSATSYDSNLYIASFAQEMMYKRTGNCAHYSALLALLLNHLGYDCRLIDGEFVNNDGTTMEHKWNYVLLDGAYYWLDVRIDHSMGAHSGKYYYFLEPSTAVWDKSHNWDHTYSDFLAANAAQIGEQVLIDATIAVDPWSRTAPWASEVIHAAGASGLIDFFAGYDFTKPISRQEFGYVALSMYCALGGDLPQSAPSPFTDTADLTIAAAAQLGIVSGTGNGRYSPDKTLTREQAVAMLGRVCELISYGEITGGASLTDAAVPFPDETSIAPYASSYAAYFAQHGIVSGMADGSFAPKKTMTREQAIRIVYDAISHLEP